MAPRKKTSPLEKENIAPGVSRVTVGKHFTRRSEKRIELNITTEAWRKYISENPLPENYGSFDGYIAVHEKRAKKILEDAGLPIETDRYYTMPGGELLLIPTIQEGATDIYTRAGGLLELVTSRDYREREALEWYAAEILGSVLNIRLAIRRGDVDIAAICAVELGILIAESEWVKFSKDSGKSSQEKRKRQASPYPVLARFLRLNYPDGPDVTDEHRFEMVPTISDDELTLGRYRFHRNAGRIHAEERVGGKSSGKWAPVGKPLKLAAFRKHMTKERKRITR